MSSQIQRWGWGRGSPGTEARESEIRNSLNKQVLELEGSGTDLWTYRGGNWSSEKSSALPKVTQPKQGSGKGRWSRGWIWNPLLYSPKPSFLPSGRSPNSRLRHLGCRFGFKASGSGWELTEPKIRAEAWEQNSRSENKWSSIQSAVPDHQSWGPEGACNPRFSDSFKKESSAENPALQTVGCC